MRDQKLVERQLAVCLHPMKEDIRSNAVIIDATGPLVRVVDDIVLLVDVHRS